MRSGKGWSQDPGLHTPELPWVGSAFLPGAQPLLQATKSPFSLQYFSLLYVFIQI